MMTYKISIINGPNLNLLGKREPSIYGTESLQDLQKNLTKIFSDEPLNLSFFQSNHEGEMIDAIHNTQDCQGVIINAGAYTHTSIAIRDALLAIKIPFIEVHLSNVYAREDFRHHSYLSSIAKAVICGAGFDGYEFAIRHFINILKR